MSESTTETYQSTLRLSWPHFGRWRDFKDAVSKQGKQDIVVAGVDNDSGYDPMDPVNVYWGTRIAKERIIHSGRKRFASRLVTPSKNGSASSKEKRLVETTAARRR